VVLLHHAVIPYTYFGHTDPKSFFGFDMIVLATDSFFMAMFFFLSGLFVWPGLAHKAPLNFFRDRLLRLGLPFAICAFTIIPIAYYAISLRQHPDRLFGILVEDDHVGPWPSGPIWFLWVLARFDLVGEPAVSAVTRLLDPINRLSLHGYAAAGEFFAVSACRHRRVLCSGGLYFGPSHWFEFGPFSVQAAACCSMPPTSSSAPASALRISIAGC
jgi:hypothetical protein